MSANPLSEFLNSLRDNQLRQRPPQPQHAPNAVEFKLVGATREAVQRQIDVLVRCAERDSGSVEVVGPIRTDAGWGAIAFADIALIDAAP